MKTVEEMLAMSVEERSSYLYGLSRKEYGEFLKMPDAEQINFSRIFTHVHSDMGSPKDAILTNDQYIETCKEFGTKYLTITDHGSMYDVQSLYDECHNSKKGNELELIIGCEFYVCDDDVHDSSLKHTRLHLVGYAKDKVGYKALARLVTESNYRIIKAKKEQYPCVSRDLLMKYIGPGTEGHGHVILTSACIGGVLTGISFEQNTARKNIEKLTATYENNKRAYDLAIYSQNKINTLEAMKSQTADKAALDSIKVQISEFKKNITATNNVIKKYNNNNVFTLEEFAIFIESQKKTIEEMSAGIIPESRMKEEMTKAAKWYDACAGHGDFYIEIQYHGLPEEKKYELTLCEIAHELNMPLIAGIDAHMQKKDGVRARKYVNALRFDLYESPSESDAELYLKSDTDLYRWLKAAVASDYAVEAIVNCANLYEQCHVKLEKENHYPIYPISEEESMLIATIPDFY